MKQKHTFPILLALVAILLCCTLIAAGTFALFSDEVKLPSHLRAGTLKVKLERTGLTKNEPDENGYLKKTVYTDAAYHDYSVRGEDEPNLFGIEEGVLLLPGCWYETELKLSNESDAAFAWWLEITLENPSGSETSAADLAEQLLITVTDKTADDPAAASLITDATGAVQTEASVLSDGTITVGDESHPAGRIAVGDPARTLFVRVAFKDLEAAENNKAQGETVRFDLTVHAVQATASPAE